MVFQSFALFPWLTVQQNVELGLEAQGVRPGERERRAGQVLELIGLAGFGGALPRELSGGMRQRVGIARALVTNPDVLLMDEAFSALDVLTGETLRNDILELWDSNQIPTRGIVVVSHNIEEAVMMADRIIILSSDPGRIVSEVKIGLPRPREVDSPKVRALVDHVYGLMTMRQAARPVVAGAAPAAHPDYRLPDTDIDRIEAVLDLIAEPPFDGRADLPQLAEEAELPDEELFPTYEALTLLGLAQVEQGDIMLTALGMRYAGADQMERQEIFGRQLLAQVPLAARIRQQLTEEESGTLSEQRFIDLLEEFLKEDEAKRTLEIAVEWGRYGEVYEYDYHLGRLKLPGLEPKQARG
jgi:NitT/TauT family transport system ATP-binding protein